VSDRILLEVNDRVCEMLGYGGEELANMDARVLYPTEEEYERVGREKYRQIEERGTGTVETCWRRKDGSILNVLLSSTPLDPADRSKGVTFAALDITDRKKAEAQVQQHLAELTRAWHANMLGEMASGLAHELNQPLCAIVNYSHGCLRLTRKKDYSIEIVRGSIEQIAAQAQRAADILKRIRGLIAKREPQHAALDLESILAGAVYLLKDEAVQHNVAIISRLEANLPRIKGDSVEIEQVVLNLMRNAIEAMNDPRIVHRTLTISNCLPDPHRIEIAVTDTGRGIPTELAERIFESFFTTKTQGLGIGLSLSRRIIEAHRGRLWAESDGRSGTTFRFTLPVEGDTYGEG
jgi:PAS domain S-box-containing protein